MTAETDQVTVGNVMHAGVVTCPPEATLREVAGILAANRIHAVVVATSDDRPPAAVITDRDVVYGHAVGKLDELTARDAATEPTITVRVDADVRHAAELMSRHGTTHILVTDTSYGTPIGILSSLDVAAAVSVP